MSWILPGSHHLNLILLSITSLLWNCLPCFLVAPLQSRKVVVDPKNDFQGIVRYSSHHDANIISYRGSIDIQNWIDDFTFVQKKEYKNLPNALVHEVFYRLYQEVAKQVVASVQDIRKEHEVAMILVSGHSMGGAVALICAIELSMLRALYVQAVYTFGHPRAGNFAFAELMQKNVPNLFRVTHNHDIVPHLPPTYLNYRHSAVEVFMTDILSYNQRELQVTLVQEIEQIPATMYDFSKVNS